MLEAAFARRYPGQEEHRTALRAAAASICKEHFERGLGDDNLAKRLCGSNDESYWQGLSEILIAKQLLQTGLMPVHPIEGPDFLVELDGRRIWIEVICPTPVGIPPEWFRFESGVVKSTPHEAILLRWTSAIKEKADKLLGSSTRPEGYLIKGIVREDDAYVIAVNGRLLRSVFPDLAGVSTLPYAVEATFSVGPYAVTINRDTFEAVGSGHQYRPLIPKPNGAQVPADTFLDPRYSPISAVWATDIDESGLLNRTVPMALVHNPLAKCPISQRLLPAHTEYTATTHADYYTLEPIVGRLG